MRDKICCRSCAAELTVSFCDLGLSPLANSYVTNANLSAPESFFPLNVYVCSHCFLVQLPAHEQPENIFKDYDYFSSFSSGWLLHCERYVQSISERLELNSESRVVEVASNDGYLLQYFNKKGIATLGIEPAENVAAVARNIGIETISEFFGESLAGAISQDRGMADLIICNNVLAHVPDINDFVKGLSTLLARDGTITIEFPHLAELIEKVQFDTIYHEHYSYLSIVALKKIFEKFGLCIYDVEQLPTHGGSLRLYVKHVDNSLLRVSANVAKVERKELDLKLGSIDGYTGMQKKVLDIKVSFLNFIYEAHRQGKKVAGYGAAAKGNTFLNYCGVGKELISFVADLNVHKQNKYLPGTRIPVVGPESIASDKPDYIIIFPWNLKEEVSTQLNYAKDWGCRFVTLIPELTIS